MVQRIRLHSRATALDVALDDPRLNQGWWAVERDRRSMWRWTNGDAALPIAAWIPPATSGPVLADVELAGMPSYPIAAPAG